MPDEPRTQRLRQSRLTADLDRLGRDRISRPARMVARVGVGGEVATTVPAYYGCHPVEAYGPEVEGGEVTFQVGKGTVYVYVLGPRVPVVGDYLIAHSVGGRWVANHMGGAVDCGTFKVIVRWCPANLQRVEGATVTVKRGETVIGTFTTDVNGEVVVPFPATADYTIDVEAEHFFPSSTTFHAECNVLDQVHTVTLAAREIQFQFPINGCQPFDCPLPDVLGEIWDDDGFYASCITVMHSTDLPDVMIADCHVWIPLPATGQKVFQYRISKSLYETKEGTYTVNAFDCFRGLSETLLTVPNYFCFGVEFCRDPMPAILSVTLGSSMSLYGSLAGSTRTLNQVAFGVPSWSGCWPYTGGGLGGTHLNIIASVVNDESCEIPIGQVDVGSFAGGCLDVGGVPTGQSAILPMVSGTGACPVAFVAEGSPDNWTATVSQ